MTPRSDTGRAELFAPPSDDGPDRSGNVWLETAASPDFVELRRRLLRFVVPATVGFLLWFFTYVCLTAWAPDLLGEHVAGGVTVVLVIAVGQFASTFAITALYARYASRRLDPLAERIRRELEETGGERRG